MTSAADIYIQGGCGGCSDPTSDERAWSYAPTQGDYIEFWKEQFCIAMALFNPNLSASKMLQYSSYLSKLPYTGRQETADRERTEELDKLATAASAYADRALAAYQAAVHRISGMDDLSKVKL